MQNIHISQMFHCFIGSFPGSMIDEYRNLRKGTKSALIPKMNIKVTNPKADARSTVSLVDGCQLWYHVVWPTQSNPTDLAHSMDEYFKDHPGQVLMMSTTC